MTIPGKVQSYLATGIPIVAMLDGEGAHVISKASAGMACAAGDADGLAQLVLKLFCMTPQLRKEMGLRGKNLYMQEFDRKVLIDRLEHWLVRLRMDFPKGIA
jgi:glycosyltransferase involved in cell wall biosynthesis